MSLCTSINHWEIIHLDGDGNVTFLDSLSLLYIFMYGICVCLFFLLCLCFQVYEGKINSPLFSREIIEDIMRGPVNFRRRIRPLPRNHNPDLLPAGKR